MNQLFNYKKKLYAAGVFVLLGFFGLASASTVSAYCTDGFFQYADGQLKKLDPVNGLYINIGDQNQTGVINAVGFDTTSCRIYGLNSEFNGNVNNSFVNLFRTDPSSGIRTILGTITNSTNSSQTLTNVLVNALTDTDGIAPNFTSNNYGKGISIGEFNNGKLYIAIGNQGNQRPLDKENDLYIVDIATQTYTKVNITYPGSNDAANRIGPDMVYYNGLLYSVNGYDSNQHPRLNIIDPLTGILTSRAINTLPKGDDSYGAMWIANDGGTYRMFVSRNSDGAIYEITDFTTPTPSTTFIDTFGGLSNNDGASDPDAPVPSFGINAMNDFGTGILNTPLNINWIANDTGNTIFSLSGFDKTSANGGKITTGPAGTFIYTPATGFYGTDTFTYQICLNGVMPLVCDSATVTVVIPVSIDAVNDSGHTSLNTPVNINWVANDTGSNAFSLSGFDKISANGGKITTGPAGTFTYTPATGFAGTDTFTYQICINSTSPAVCDTATVTVTIPNNLPTANDDAVTTALNTAVNIPVLNNDTYGLDGTGTINLTGTTPNHGTVVDNGNGTYKYIPNTGYAGTDTFEYQICDSNGDCDTAMVTITILPNVSDMSVTKTGPSSFTSGTVISYVIIMSNNGPDAATGTLSDIFPSGFTYISSSTGTVSANTLSYGRYLTSGQSYAIIVTGTVLGSSGATIANTARVTSSETDSNTGNDSATTTGIITFVPVVSDMSVTKTGPSSFTSGTVISYVIIMSNNGPDAATGTLSDIFPSGFTYISSSTGTVSANTLSYGRYLTSGQSYAIIVTGTVLGSSGATIANTARVTSSETDSNTGNDSATTTGIITFVPVVTVPNYGGGGGNGGTYINTPISSPSTTTSSPTSTTTQPTGTVVPIAEILNLDNNPKTSSTNSSLLELLSTGPSAKVDTKGMLLPKTGADL